MPKLGIRDDEHRLLLVVGNPENVRVPDRLALRHDRDEALLASEPRGWTCPATLFLEEEAVLKHGQFHVRPSPGKREGIGPRTRFRS